MSAALRLAKAGHQVTVLEQGERVGGKLNVWEPEVAGAGRFRFDTGPHVLTMPWAIREMFEDLGERMEDHLDLVRMDPICRYHFADGSRFDAPADPEEAARRVSESFPGDEAGFRALLAYARHVHDVTVDPFLRQDFAEAVRGVPSPAQWRQLTQFLGLRPWETISQLSLRHLRHPRLRQIFDLYAFYNGSSPYKASAIFAIIAWVQWGDGTYYLRGGLRTYADALARLAEKLGVEVRTNTRVGSISPMFAFGPGDFVRIEGEHKGERFESDEQVVICNADPMTAYESLAPDARPKGLTADAVQPSTSAFVMLLGLKGTPERDFPHLTHFNSFLPDDPKAEFDAIFSRNVPADDPVIGVTCQSVTEPACAPPGHSTLFVMTSPPAMGPEWEWTDENTGAYRERVLSLLETRCGMPGLRERIVCEQVWTPKTFAERYGAWRGSLYGVSSNGWRSAFLRPPTRSRTVKGLYFVGGGTHPGGGLPLVTLGGKIVAESVLRHESDRRPKAGR
jgi:phytoene desaturase